MGALYQSLFPPGSKVEKALQEALRLTEHQNTQLRFQLKFEADVVQRSRLADYPWEMLHDPQGFLVFEDEESGSDYVSGIEVINRT